MALPPPPSKIRRTSQLIIMSSKRAQQLAVALQYALNAAAPRVIAKGSAQSADAIVALAKKHNIKIVVDGDLTHTLTALDIKSEIPEKLYHIVALILASVYREKEDVD